MNKRKIIKRMIGVLLACGMLWACLCFSACSIRFGSGEKQQDDRPYIVCTVFPQYDFVRNIVGNKMRVDMLMAPGSETHSFTLSNLSLFQIEELHRADLFVFVGGEGDEQLLSEMKTVIKNEATFLTMLSLVKDPLCTTHEHEEQEEEHDHDHDHEESAYDEHVWTSPKRVMEIVEGLCTAICKLDPENEAFYKENAKAYTEKLSLLDGKLESLKQERAYDTVIFADRYPFRYLCEDYGITAYAALSGCSTVVEPSLTVLSDLYKKAESMNLPAILYIENSNPAYAKDIAKRCGGKALMLHSCHMLSEKEFGNKDYISVMEENLETLRYALGVGKDGK